MAAVAAGTVNGGMMELYSISDKRRHLANHVIEFWFHTSTLFVCLTETEAGLIRLTLHLRTGERRKKNIKKKSLKGKKYFAQKNEKKK